ncbi:hypothetical protein PAMP_018525 [Pampus punctatissimus]
MFVDIGLLLPFTAATGRYAELQVEFSSAVRTSAEQKELILKLEHDLSTIQAMSSLPRPDADGSEVGNMENIPEPIKEATAMFAGSSVISHPELPQGQMDSLLSIISSQRERFRSRNQELEAESRSMQQTMQALQNELDSLRADNIKLYEKIKFLQSYPGRAGGSDDTVMRYSSQYEERLDPFASFSKKERQRRYLSLSPWDKATLSLGRVILSNKIARTVAFFYTLFLHCLVFLFQSNRFDLFTGDFRCCTRRLGARVSAETAQLSALKSTLTISTVSMRTTKTSKLSHTDVNTSFSIQPHAWITNILVRM